MLACSLGAGLLAGNFCVQLRPSHTHVSATILPPTAPPNITTCCRAASYAIARELVGGGLVAGNLCVQLFPSHTQVSLKAVLVFGLAPPNITICPRAAS